MPTHTIKKKSTFNDLENSLKIVIASPDIKLRLPSSLSARGGFGVEGILCLLLGTWLKRGCEKKVLHTFSQHGQPKDFSDLCSSFYGICALRLADTLLTADKKKIKHNDALQEGFLRFRKLSSGDYANAFKGMYLAFPAIKSKEVNREFNNPLYNSESVLGSAGFSRLLDTSLKQILTSTQYRIVEPKISRIAEVIRELFENTHEHARADEFGDPLPFNFRGIILNSVSLTSERLDELSMSGDKGLTMFCSEWKGWIQHNEKALPALDITVVDAGQGFARRWTKMSQSDISVIQEIEAVAECFKANNSRIKKEGYGKGLPNVLSDLRKLHGWFRLRTGSLSVSKSYYKGTGDLLIDEKNIAKKESFIEGSSFNFVIPLVEEQ